MRGFYITLDGHVDRHEKMQSELERYGMKDYHRLQAVDGKNILRRDCGLLPAEMACFYSHLRALRSAEGHTIHILEDDVVFSDKLPILLDLLINSNVFEIYDIILTDAFVQIGVAPYLESLFELSLEKRFEEIKIIDAKGLNVAHASSYIVGGNSLSKVIEHFETALGCEKVCPYDIVLRAGIESGTLKAALLFPFPTSTRMEYIENTSIIGRPGQHFNNPRLRAYSLLRALLAIPSPNGPTYERVSKDLFGDSLRPEASVLDLIRMTRGYIERSHREDGLAFYF